MNTRKYAVCLLQNTQKKKKKTDKNWLLKIPLGMTAVDQQPEPASAYHPTPSISPPPAYFKHIQ
jgi:hypothetical protein